MASILGKVWTIYDATEESPFQSGDEVEITKDAKVKFGTKEWPGQYLEVKDKVVVASVIGEYWEFTGSETLNGKLTMYGLRWSSTLPDAMGTWVSDPQG